MATEPRIAPRAAFDLRRAGDSDAALLAAIHREARAVAMPWLPKLHTPAEDLFFFEHSVLPSCDVWVAERAGAIAGFCAVRPQWLDHLYVRPDLWSQGAGRALLNKAKEGQALVHLWTFQRNLAARTFYERQGFDIAEMTDGRRNEEKEPDVLYLWQAPPSKA